MKPTFNRLETAFIAAIVPLAALLFVVNDFALSKDADTTATKLILSISMAFLFGTLCLFLIRLNHRLKGTISAHETTELALTKLSSAVTNSGSLIVITDGEGIIEYVNEKFCQITQYRRSESIGRSILMLSGRNASETRSETTWNLHCLNSGWEGELLSRKKDGSEFWSAITISAVSRRVRIVVRSPES